MVIVFLFPMFRTPSSSIPLMASAFEICRVVTPNWRQARLKRLEAGTLLPANTFDKPRSRSLQRALPPSKTQDKRTYSKPSKSLPQSQLGLVGVSAPKKDVNPPPPHFPQTPSRPLSLPPPRLGDPPPLPGLSIKNLPPAP